MLPTDVGTPALLEDGASASKWVNIGNDNILIKSVRPECFAPGGIEADKRNLVAVPGFPRGWFGSTPPIAALRSR